MNNRNALIDEPSGRASNGNGASGTSRAKLWVATMGGSEHGQVVTPHKEPIEYIPFEGPREVPANRGQQALLDLQARLDLELQTFSPSATLSTPGFYRAQNKPVKDHRDDLPLVGLDLRTRFEKDRDRIQHFEAFRRLSYKTQVHLNPDDHQRTRMTHTIEVNQIACAISSALRLNVALTSAIALGHDCGHGPGGHASEDALNPYLPEGFNHAKFGADVTLVPLNLCIETLDGIRNHSWSLDTPMTPEGDVVSFADRIAYVCHDLEDALRCQMVTSKDFPKELAAFMSLTRSEQIDFFIRSVIEGTSTSGSIAMLKEGAEILKGLRAFNNEKIYQHPISVAANEDVIKTLRELVDFYIDNPGQLPEKQRSKIDQGVHSEVEGVVAYVAGMTDNFAYRDHLEKIQRQHPLDGGVHFL
ncbi:MAG: HD domain-containing protein [Acidimicrobiia bacterium]